MTASLINIGVNLSSFSDLFSLDFLLFLGNMDKVLIIFTFFVNFYCRKVKTFERNTKIFRKMRCQFCLNKVAYLCNLSFYLQNRNTVFDRIVGNILFDQLFEVITYLVAKSFKTEIDQSVELYKLLYVRQGKSDLSSCCHRNCEINKSRVCHVKVWYAKLYLIVALQIEEINFGRKRRRASKCFESTGKLAVFIVSSYGPVIKSCKLWSFCL